MNKQIIVGVLVVLAIAGVGVMLTLGGADWQSKNVLVYGRGADSKVLDPGAIDDGESVKVVVNIYEPLVQITFDEAAGKLVVKPLLAEKWAPLEGKPGFKFTLRSGIKFHDGTPCDAAAVAYSLKRLVKGKSEAAGNLSDPEAAESPYRAYYKTLVYDGIKAVGDLDLEIETTVPDAQLLINLAMFPAAIVCPAAVKKYGADFGKKGAVGTGPFVFKVWMAKQKIELDANKDYWGGAPTIKQVKFLEVGDNNSRKQALVNGDLAYIDNFNPQDIAELEKNPNIVVQTRPTGREISLLYLALNTSVAPFNNLKFRQAIAHAIDKDKIAGLYYGIATRAELAVPPGIQGHSPEIKGFARDVEKAKALLAESGVKERKLTLSFMANPRPYIRQPKEVARAIKDSLGEIGIEVTLEVLPWATYLPKVQKAEHQMGLLGWTTDNGDADNFLSTFYSSDNAVVGKAMNISFFKDEVMDKLLGEQQRIVEPAERQKVLDKIYKHAVNSSPLLPLVYVKDMIAYNKAVQDVSLHPLGKHLFGGVKIVAAKK